jgi:ribonuclease PH
LIGRSLRAAVDLSLLGERTLLIDCDVIQADGGTRTASINGSYVAVAIALKHLISTGTIPEETLLAPVAAVSVGMVSGQPCLDLDYAEDSSADVDLNVVMTADGKFIEVQGTAEKEPYDRQSLNQMLDLAEAGIQEIIRKQNAVMK